MNYTLEFTMEDALDKLLDHIKQPTSTETIALGDALGRVAASDQIALMNQPPFDRSPLDGYAVRHTDIQGAHRQAPAILRVTQHIYAGDVPTGPIATGEAARVMTGVPLPADATCVVRQEDTDGGEEMVLIYVEHKRHDNYCLTGEDVEQGEILVQKGQRFDAAALAVLASQGILEVDVFFRPYVGILSTGNELIAVGSTLPFGKIYDSNRYYIASRVTELGGIFILGDNAEDDPMYIAHTLQKLLSQCEMVITTGGVSVGAHDFMSVVGETLGAAQLFHGIDLKPGGSTLAFARDDKILLCLSGNPFAAAATFEILAGPTLHKLCGDSEILLERTKAVLQNNYPKASRGRRLLRARIKGNQVVLPKGGHSSSIMRSMIGCNCLVDIPAGSPPLEPGAQVEVILL
ncbi:MAG: molybdopterin molybdotransferase MoeA [Synergistaceae bacterium]|jgi:molybdopterin molybdotransferase|nr:molybdopterin molybdotransferase MoeA [Synergistaceae bacterium]